MADEASRDDARRRLAEIQDRLLELAPDDFAARHELHLERDRLRRVVRQAATDLDAHRSTEDLQAELDARKEALEDIKKRMVNTAGMAGGGGGGAGSYEGPLDGMKINNAIRFAQGTDRLVQRIAHLQRILRARGEV